jgi:DNA-binding CsgD family transcriptional regulator/tetratricopeptide (TPR) repeat protein
MLVERGQFLDSLSALLGELSAGDGRLVFLGGEAGVGKTTLAGALLASVPPDVVVRRGACDSLTTAAALGPIIEALPEIDTDLGVDARVDKLRIARHIREVVGATPTLVLLEDVHWADDATLDLLRILCRRLARLPVLILATFRTDEVAPDHPLTILLGELATVSGVVRMQLPALTPAGVRELAAASGSSLDPDELHRETGGNAFYVTEVLAAPDGFVPATVRDAVLARAHRLSPAARQVLAAMAVLGHADLALLTDVSGVEPEAVDECVRSGMLVPDGGRLGFRHELARLAVEQSQSPGELAKLHAAALRGLRAAHRGDDRRLAHHAAGSGDRAAVLVHARRAAEHAARLGAHREGAELYRLAIRSGDADEQTRGELCAALSYECYLTDQLAEAHAARAEAMQIAEQLGDTRSVGVAQRWLSRLSWFLARNEDSERWAARAIATLEPLGDSSELAMAYSNLAQLRMLANEPGPAIEWGNRAIAMARALGDREVEMHALNNVGTAYTVAGDEERGHALLTQSLEMALTDDAQEHAARAYTNLSSRPVSTRDFAAAERHLRAGIAYCADRDLDSWWLYMSSWRARVLAERGEYEAAESVAAEVLRHPQLSAVTRIGAGVVSAQVALRRGRADGGLLDEIARLAAATGEAQRVVPVALARAEAAWLADRPDDIVVEIDAVWELAVAHPDAWELGELAWWLSVAGVRRPIPIGVASPFAAMLAGRWHDAEGEWAAIGCPLWQALALARAPDLADARAALALIDGLRATAVREAVLRDRHQAGLAVPRGPRAASRNNEWGLTGREIEILQLLNDGLSNAELAGRLYLSEKTVGHHVSAILRKLGEPSRSRAVAAARRRGIVTPN